MEKKYDIPLLEPPVMPMIGAPNHDMIEELESEFEKRFKKSAALVSSATAGLHLALILSGVKEGDYVLAPTFTYVATINPILYLGANPVLIDSEMETWGMDPDLCIESVKSLIQKGKKPKAIILVHPFGYPAQIEAFQEISEEYGIDLIEDAAGAYGSKINGEYLGGIGDYGVISFNNNKVLSGFGGGLVLLKNKEEKLRVKSLIAHGRKINEEKYFHVENGYNYRISLLSVAMILSSLERADNQIDARKEVSVQYANNLDRGYFLSQQSNIYVEVNSWLTSVLIQRSKPERITALIHFLATKGIEAKRLWYPMHLQPFLKDVRMNLNGNSENLFNIGVSLPSSSSLTKSEIGMISDLLKDFFTR